VFSPGSSPTNYTQLNQVLTTMFNFVQSSCLIGDDPSVSTWPDRATLQTCREHVRSSLCRLFYSPCTNSKPEPLCFEDCQALTSCLKTDGCRQVLPFDCDGGVTKGYVRPPNDPRCVPFYHHQAPPPKQKGEHRPNCTAVPPSTHACARSSALSADKYLRLFGKKVDVLFDPMRLAMRFQPPNTSETDGNVPTVVLEMASISTAVRLSVDANGVEKFGPPIDDIKIGAPEVSCKFTPTEQFVTLSHRLTSESTLRVVLSVADQDRKIVISPSEGLVHTVDGGVVKFSVFVDGSPFKNKATAATHVLVNMNTRMQNLPVFLRRVNSTDIYNEFLAVWIDGARFEVRIVKRANIDNVVQKVNAGFAASEEAFISACPTLPSPIVMPLFQKSIDYDPDISFLYEGSNGVDEQRGEVDILVGDEKMFQSPFVSDGDPSGGPDTAGIAVGVVVVLLLIVVGVPLAVWSYRRRRESQREMSDATQRMAQYSDGYASASSERVGGSDRFSLTPTPSASFSMASSLPSTTTFAPTSLPQQPPLYSSSGSSGTQPLYSSSQPATYATQMPLPQTPLPQVPSDLSAEGAQLYGDVNAALAAQNTTMIAASVKALVTRARAQQPAQAADKSSEFHKHCVALATAAREACVSVTSNGGSGSATAVAAQRVQSAAASLAQFV
jgi:hypothetical protein